MLDMARGLHAAHEHRGLFRDVHSASRRNEGKWPKGISQFDYFYSAVTTACWERLDPEIITREERRKDRRLIAHDDSPHGETGHQLGSPSEKLSAEYHIASLLDDSNEIFEYAAADKEALRAQWAIEKLVAWRIDGSAEPEHNFMKFVQYYWDHRPGISRPETILDMIKRDQRLFCDYLDRRGSTSDEALYEELARESIERGQPITMDSVKKIVARYREHYNHWKTGALTPM